MISTKTIVSDVVDVPREWIFEFYLKLDEKLCGQDVKIKSVFNSKDKNPSMCVYVDGRNNYRYKDFSSGIGGDALDLVMHLFNLATRGTASFKVVQDYNEYLKNNDYVQNYSVRSQSRYQVTDYEMRHWTNFDEKYWTGFKISSGQLEKYNVVPLNHYILTRENDITGANSLTIKTRYLYGYFREDGVLYKIYQPKSKDNKFLKVRDYIQGSEQLKYNKPYLIIVSSLKDLLALNMMNIGGIEAIAPDSENIMIPDPFMQNAMQKYKKVLILFDNDEAGKQCAARYTERYNLTCIDFTLSKDIADALRDHGVEKTRAELFPLLKQAL
jgi:5S rRNA maturation endonuclease (ribonuclease M5)